MKSCAYCAGPMRSTKALKGKHSHGICKPCVKGLEDAVRFAERQIKQCPSCVRNIGAWLKNCHPCEVSKCLSV